MKAQTKFEEYGELLDMLIRLRQHDPDSMEIDRLMKRVLNLSIEVDKQLDDEIKEIETSIAEILKEKE